MLLWYYGAFHKTYDKQSPKFVWNSRTSPWTWKFHYVVVNQIMNFEMKLWISRRISLFQSSLRAKFAPFGVVGLVIYLQMNLNKVKTFLNKQGLFDDVYFWNVNYLRYRGTPHHRRMVCKYNSVTTRQWNILFFHAVSRM